MWVNSQLNKLANNYLHRRYLREWRGGIPSLSPDRVRKSRAKRVLDLDLNGSGDLQNRGSWASARAAWKDVKKGVVPEDARPGVLGSARRCPRCRDSIKDWPRADQASRQSAGRSGGKYGNAGRRGRKGATRPPQTLSKSEFPERWNSGCF